MQTITPAVATTAALPPVYTREAHLCGIHVQRKVSGQEDALVDITVANEFAKPAVSWLIPCH